MTGFIMLDDCGMDVSILIPQPFIETAANVAKGPTKTLEAAQFITDEIVRP